MKITRAGALISIASQQPGIRPLAATFRRKHLLAQIALTAATWTVLAEPLHAINFVWNKTSGANNYGTTANWTPDSGSGVPTAPDTAVFGTGPGSYSVNINTSPTNAAVNFTVGNVTFSATNSANRTYSVTGNTTINAANLTLTGTANSLLMATTGTLSISGAGSVTLNQGNTMAAGVLDIGPTAGSTGFYSLNGAGVLSVNGSEFIGSGGRGSFTQTAGTNSVTNSLTLGSAAGASGFYSLTGTGLLSVNGEEFIGANGLGSLTHTTGTHTVASNLYLGANSGSSGFYVLSGTGLLSVNGDEFIGDNGLGSFTHTAGTHTVGNSLYLGSNSGSSSGFYNLSGTGLLSVNSSEFIGNSGIGSFTHTAGTHTVASNLYLGLNSGSRGFYRLSGAALLSANVEFIGDLGLGSFTHTAGTNTVASSLHLGVESGSSGFYRLSGTGLLSANFEEIGFLGLGSFTHTAGTNTVASSLFLGVNSGGSGFYNLSGTGLLSVNGTEFIGNNALGSFSQTGGTHTVTSALQLGASSGGSGFYLLDGASAILNVGSAYIGGTIASGGGTGILNIQTGTMNVTGTLKIWDTGSTAVNLSGGILSIGSFDVTGNLSRFNWTAGTLNFLNGFTVDPNFSLGNSVTLSSGKTLASTNTGTNNGTIILAGGVLNGSIVNNSIITGYGTLGGTGGFINNALLTQIGGHLIVSNSLTNFAHIQLAAGYQLQLTGSNLSNSGTLDLNDATVNGSATLINNVDGIINGPGVITSAFTNAGLITLPAGTLKVPNFTNTGVIELGDITANLSSTGTVTNSATIEGHGKISALLTNNATIEALGGTLVLTASLTNSASGILRSGASTKILIQGAGNFPTNAGLISLVGGTIDTGGQTLNNTGQISGYGVLATGGLTNNNIMVLTGGTTTVNGPVTNSLNKTLLIKNDPALFTGPVTNNGTIKTTNTIVTFTSNYTGNAYISDPSTNIFSANVTITPGGSMTGALGDQFILTGSSPSLFTNNGTFTNGGFLSSSVSAVNTGTFTQTGSQTWSTGTTFTNSGTATFGSDAGASSTFNLNLHLTAGTVTLNSPQHLASLTLDPTGTSFSGTVDLKNNYLLLGPGNSSSTLRAYLLSGITNGTGLKSTSATAAQAIGYLDANIYNIFNPNHLFQGQTLVGNELLTKLTWQGDADLSGYITMNDYAQLEAGFFFGHFNGNAGNNPASWAFGDFNYDGLVNVQDYALIDNAFHLQSGTLADDLISQHALQFGNPYTQFLSSLSTPIPEPASLALLSLCVPSLLRRPRSTRLTRLLA